MKKTAGMGGGGGIGDIAGALAMFNSLSPEEQREFALKTMELQRLQLEDLRNNVENESARRDEIVRRHREQQRELLAGFRKAKEVQEHGCNHRKGGKDEKSLPHNAGGAGHDASDYCITETTYPWGETVFACFRCYKEYWPVSNIQKVAQRAFLEGWTLEKATEVMQKEYEWASERPTKNTPCGSQIFSIGKTPAAQQREYDQAKAQLEQGMKNSEAVRAAL